jgi:AcrR family transcriptional regulator
MGTVWQRARSDAQKEQRKAALLAAATRMLATRPLDEISLNAIAREANISKANVYRYFESREELLLHLTLDAFDQWRDQLVKGLERSSADDAAERVAEAVVQATVDNPTYARLSAVLSTVLERNVSTEGITRFKRGFMGRTEPLVAAFADALPELPPQAHLELLMVVFFQIAAMWPAAHPTPAVQAAFDTVPELTRLHVKFEPGLHRVIVVTIAGLRALET